MPAKDKRNILIAPIAFVSEHIETLVELGEEYKLLAEQHDAPSYTRVEALGVHPGFITDAGRRGHSQLWI